MTEASSPNPAAAVARPALRSSKATLFPSSDCKRATTKAFECKSEFPTCESPQPIDSSMIKIAVQSSWTLSKTDLLYDSSAILEFVLADFRVPRRRQDEGVRHGFDVDRLPTLQVGIDRNGEPDTGVAAPGPYFDLTNFCDADVNIMTIYAFVVQTEVPGANGDC